MDVFLLILDNAWSPGKVACSSPWRHVKKEQMSKMKLKWGVTGVPSPPSIHFPLSDTAVKTWTPTLCRLTSIVGSWRSVSFLAHGSPGICQRDCVFVTSYSFSLLTALLCTLWALVWVNVLVMAKAECSTVKCGCLFYCDSPKNQLHCFSGLLFPYPIVFLLIRSFPRSLLSDNYKFLCNLPRLKWFG